MTQPLSAHELPTRARTLAPALFEWTTGLSQSIARDIATEGSESEVRQPPAIALQVEALLYTLHVTDRLAYQLLGNELRRIFMDALLNEVHALLPPNAMPPAMLEEAYAEKQFYYSRFGKLFAEKDEPLKGTLCWEFGKSMATLYGDLNPVSITLISMAGMRTIGALQEMLTNPTCGIVRDGPAASLA